MEQINTIDIRISGPEIIPTIDPPIVNNISQNIIRGLEVPIIDVPRAIINYPIINVPTKEEFDTAVRAQQKLPEDNTEKDRKLPDFTPTPTPNQLSQITQSITPQTTELPDNKPQPTFTVFGTDINLPSPSLIATASTVAVVTTGATMVSTVAFNALKNITEPIIRDMIKNKLKVKIKQVRPVLHYILSEDGGVNIFEYSSNGTRLIGQVDNVEQYIRDQIDLNSLYEIENKIIIDDTISKKFTKEGQKRFRSLFAPSHKIAKKLSARLSF